MSKTSGKKTPQKPSSPPPASRPVAGSLPAYSPIGEDVYKKVFYILIAILMFALPIISGTVGVNADERWQIPKSKALYDYYRTFGEDTTLMRSEAEANANIQKFGAEKAKEMGVDRWLPDEEKLAYYGGFFELTSAVINNILGFNDEFKPGYVYLRHGLIAIMGVLAIFFAGLIARKLGGWRAAVLTAFLLAISPVFIGHTYMNPKDIPFAFGYIMSVYFIIRFLEDMPGVNWRAVVGLIAAIAITINIRAGGILLIVYFGFFTGLTLFYHMFVKKNSEYDTRSVVKIVGFSALVAVAGYFLGIIFWPYAFPDPVGKPLEALSALTNYEVNLRQLFEGKQLMSTELPWYYLPKYIFITSPIVVLLGFVLFGGLMYSFRKTFRMNIMGVVLFTMLFPLFYIIYKKSNVYNGWRHVLFIYPFIAVCAALGWDWVLQKLRTKPLHFGGFGIIAIMAIFPVGWMVANHPFEYAYFNKLAGGTDAAYTDYVTDYWMMSIKPAAEELAKKENLYGTKKKVIIGTNCFYPALVHCRYISDSIEVRYVRYYEKWQKDWDYGLFYNDYVSPGELRSKAYPPDGTIITVTAEGAPMGVALKRPDTIDLEAYAAYNASNFPVAIAKFNEALKTRPKAVEMHRDLGLAYLNSGDFSNAVIAFSNALNLNKEDFSTYYYLGIAHAQTNPPQYDLTQRYMKKALELNPEFTQAQQVLNQLNQSQKSPSPF